MMFGDDKAQEKTRPRHVMPKRTPTMQLVSQISTFNANKLKLSDDEVQYIAIFIKIFFVTC